MSNRFLTAAGEGVLPTIGALPVTDPSSETLFFFDSEKTFARRDKQDACQENETAFCQENRSGGPTLLTVTDLAAATIATLNLEIARLRAGIETAHQLITAVLAEDIERHPREVRVQCGGVQTVLSAARLNPNAPAHPDRRRASDPGQSIGECPHCGGSLYPGGTLWETAPVAGVRVEGVACVCEDCGNPQVVVEEEQL